MSNQSKIEEFFLQLSQFVDDDVPHIVAETATELFKDSFRDKAWDKKPWKPAKRKKSKGSLMITSSNLMRSIKPSHVSPERVTISAGSSDVPYAKIHNEGGQIIIPPRKDNFVRKRFKSGKQKGRFRKGKLEGEGFSYRETRIFMPQRQFMGVTPYIGQVILNRIEKHFKSR
jgi:phage gpG-like protein